MSVFTNPESRIPNLALALALLFVFTHARATEMTAEQASRYQALVQELRCLVCQNQSIAESNAPLAADLREQVRGQIEAGRGDAEIIQFLTDRYGDFVRYRPPFKARTWLLWLGPFAAVLLAGGVAITYIRRSRKPSVAALEPTPMDAGVAAPTAATLGAPRLSSRVFVLAVIGLLAFAGVWYALAGNWRTQALINLAKTNPEAAQAAALESMSERLRGHVEKNPGDAEAWIWLGRSAMRQERYTEAAQAFSKANVLNAGQDPDLLVEEGEALAYVHGRSLAGAPVEKFTQALALAPDHPRALWFAGLAALHAGDELLALKHWERLIQQDLPEDTRASLEQSLAEIRQRNDLKPPAASAQAGLALHLEVSITPELARDVKSGDVLLVYAQEAGGPRMPLAVRRLPANPLPLTVTLDDSHSMVPSRKLSSVDRWRLLARVSASGNAQPQAGDLQGELEVTREQARLTHKLVITERLSR